MVPRYVMSQRHTSSCLHVKKNLSPRGPLPAVFSFVESHPTCGRFCPFDFAQRHPRHMSQNQHHNQHLPWQCECDSLLTSPPPLRRSLILAFIAHYSPLYLILVTLLPRHSSAAALQRYITAVTLLPSGPPATSAPPTLRRRHSNATKLLLSVLSYIYAPLP